MDAQDFPPLGTQPTNANKQQRPKFSSAKPKTSKHKPADESAAIKKAASPRRTRSVSKGAEHPPPKKAVDARMSHSSTTPPSMPQKPEKSSAKLYVPREACVQQQTPAIEPQVSESAAVVPPAMLEEPQSATASPSPPVSESKPAEIPPPVSETPFGNSAFGQTSTAFSGPNKPSGLTRGMPRWSQRGRPTRFDVSTPNSDPAPKEDGEFIKATLQPFPYVVIQTGGSTYRAIIDHKQVKRNRMEGKLPRNLPPVISIAQQYVKPVTGDTPPFSTATPTLPIGTTLAIYNVFAHRTNRGPKTVQDKISNFVEKGMVIPAGFATGFTATNRVKVERVPAIVVAISDGKIRVTDRFHRDSCILPKRALRDFPNASTVREGDVAALWVYLLQAKWLKQQDLTYAIPDEHSMLDSAVEAPIKDNLKYPQIALVEPWPQDETLDLDSFFDVPAEKFKDRIIDYENLMLASAARAHEQMKAEMERATYTGRFIHDENTAANIAQVKIALPKEQEGDFKTMAKYWQEDAVFNIFLEQCETPCGVAALQQVEIDYDERTINAICFAESSVPDHLEVKEGTDLFKILEGQMPAKIKLDTEQTGFKKVFDTLFSRYMLTAFNKKYPSILPLCDFLGLPKPDVSEISQPKFNDDNKAALPVQDPASNDADMDTDSATEKPLNDRQREALLLAVDDAVNLAYMAAPPGSGKTHVDGAIAAELRKKKPYGEAILLTATTNQACVNLADSLAETGAFKPDEVLVLQSHSFYRLHREAIQKHSWNASRLTEHVKRLLLKSVFSENEKKAMDAFIAKVERGHSIRVDDDKAVANALKYNRPRVVIATLGMAQRLTGKLAPIISRMAIDEIGQVSELTFVTLLSALPRCQNAFLSGDKKQLGLYDANVPTHVRKFGHRSIIDVVTEHRKPQNVKLEKVYRSVRYIVEAVVAPLYNDEVSTDLTEADRPMRKQQLLFADTNEKPVLFIQTEHPEVEKPVRSRTNDRHTEIAVRTAKAVRRTAPDASIVVLSYYALQTDDVARQLRHYNVQCHTITSYQGRQADVVILTTTRSRPRVEDEQHSSDATAIDALQYSFVLDDQRTTVGLTRAKEMLIIIGDKDLLRFGSAWNIVLENLKHDAGIRDESLLDRILQPLEPVDIEAADDAEMDEVSVLLSDELSE